MKEELLNAVMESLKEEAALSGKKFEALMEELNSISKRIESLYAKMELVEAIYSDMKVKSDIHITSDIGKESIKSVDYDMTKVTEEPENVQKFMFDEYLHNLAERVEYCLHPYYYEGKDNTIFSIEKDLYEGRVEPYMESLNNILDTQANSLTDDFVSYMSDVIVDLAECVKDKEPEKAQENTQIPEESLGAMFGSGTNVEVPNKEDEEISSNVSVVIEESVNPVTDEVTTHYKKLESGIFFADWVTTQKMDSRIKDALASIDYIIDEVTKKDDTTIIVDENNILGIQTATGTTFYKDDVLGGNNISNFLIDVKKLMDNDIYSHSIIKCYDEVRSVEREHTRLKKKDSR